MKPPIARTTPPRARTARVPSSVCTSHADDGLALDDQGLGPGVGHDAAPLVDTAAPSRSMRNPPAESMKRGLCPRGTGTATSSKGYESSPPLKSSPESSADSRFGSSQNAARKGTPTETSQSKCSAEPSQ